ncbi:dihydrofolate reductase family protein [Niabella hibiscisoli]|uniref:dihydrofolate reductase family protein n=1 Tax=Niabella hibiscisoli TaxID=1825928 RepID=UPI001F10C643|nr:dihydrofolate reductase family protein [Niabella hibiscisoli]MCH5716817.1 dihydrofolate reductase family protein [Niabella hibiscisoli]
MRKIIVLSMITLDGVIQSPGGPKEDKSDGFKYGGWTEPYGDESYNQVVQEELKPASYLLGRKTFEIWEQYWPHHKDYWPGINEGNKYVLSTTRNQSDWNNTHFITMLADIQQLKESAGPEIQVWGSSELVHLLLSNDMVDELRLKIHPILLGRGKRLFDTAAVPKSYTLAEHIVTSTGVIIARYIRSGEVKTGQVAD